jgi:penicillin-binding protein-related factor A (putative recombinase)
MFLGKSKEDKLEGVPRIEQSKFRLIIIRYIQDSVHCLVFNDLYTLIKTADKNDISLFCDWLVDTSSHTIYYTADLSISFLALIWTSVVIINR